MIATLESDPNVVALTLQQLFDAGNAPKSVGLAIDGGHLVTAEDVVAVRRAVVWFDSSLARTFQYGAGEGDTLGAAIAKINQRVTARR